MTFHPTPPNDPHAWLLRAACRDLDVDLFFTTRGQEYPPEAVAACERCPVRAPCLAEALTYAQDADLGYRGGMSRRQRDKIRGGTYRPAMCRRCGREFDRDFGRFYCGPECKQASRREGQTAWAANGRRAS